MPSSASTSQEVYDAGRELAASSDNPANALNETLARFLATPFRAATGALKDSHGQQTDVFGTVIHTSPQSLPSAESMVFDADSAACVIDVASTLNVDNLSDAYERIARAKRLRKTPSQGGPSAFSTNVTLGIIFARDATAPFEILAENLDRLNRQHPDREWADMVVVLSKGIINHTAQFPGENITGDYLPPAENATARYLPPIYVVMVARPTRDYTFNKMCSFLLAHLMIFSPGANLPDWRAILENTPREAMAFTGYQYNLSGQLVPVPREYYNDRYLPPRPFLVKDQQGNLLATVEFLPWQDGGVVLLRGRLPLEGILVFLGKDKLKQGDVVGRPTSQISYVLPIAQADFLQMLQRFRSQSNMIVRLDPSQYVAQKMKDEGSRSPFMARLYIGILRLRDVVFPDREKRLVFDESYTQVMEALINTRSASQKIRQLIAEHFQELAEGKAGELRHHTIYIHHSIDQELCKETEAFLNSAVRMIKQGMQNVTSLLERDIGFLFMKQNSFESGVQDLQSQDGHLAAYLTETRKWSEQLIDRRNAVEHEGWILPGLKYTEAQGSIRAEEPELSGQKVSDFVGFITDRLMCFVEEVTAHCLAARMPPGIAVTEIPLPNRDPDMPLRFQVTLHEGGLPAWNIEHHQGPFEQT